MTHVGWAAIQWDKNGLPRSLLFDDKYFCEENGLLESQYIFCGGNQLKERWQNLPVDAEGTFTIAEAGFGTGLNFLCAWRLWRQCSPVNRTLHYISIDQYPLSIDDLSIALKLWPELNSDSQQLIEQYPSAFSPYHDLYFDERNVRLTLVFDHIIDAFDAMNNERVSFQPIDAWFLDGFAPSKNPQMWSEDVFVCMAQLSRPGTTLSTFTVAGKVRRGLNNQGFSISKVKGFGRKRQMLQGVFTGDIPNGR